MIGAINLSTNVMDTDGENRCLDYHQAYVSSFGLCILSATQSHMCI